MDFFFFTNIPNKRPNSGGYFPSCILLLFLILFPFVLIKVCRVVSMALFIRSFSRKLIPDRLHEICNRVYVFDCCLSRNQMSELDYKLYMDSAVSSLQRQHPGASYMVFNFTQGQSNSQSLLSDILLEHEMTVVDYPIKYEGYPLLPLEMIHYFLRSTSSWLSLEGQENVVILHCEQGGWPVLAFMLAGFLLYRNLYGDEQKTLEMVYNKAPMELLKQDLVVDSRSSQLRYLGYVCDPMLLDDAPLVIDSLVLMNVPLVDGKGCRPVVLIYGQDGSTDSDRNPRPLFSSFSTSEAIIYYHEEECLVVKLGINQQVHGDIFLECVHLGEDLVTQDIIFRTMFHTGFVESKILTLSLDEMDVVWDAKSKFTKDFKAEVHFLAFEESQSDDSDGVAIEQEKMYYESENEFFEVEEFDIYDDKRRASSLPPNYIIEELGEDGESGSGIWTQNSETMFSVESFRELNLDDYDDSDEDGDSYDSSVENIVITGKPENTYRKGACEEETTANNNSHIPYDYEAYVRINKIVDSESTEEGRGADSNPCNF